MSPLRRFFRSLRMRATRLGMLSAFLFASAKFAARPINPEPPQSSDRTELKTSETQPTFKLRVERNLVLVRVVVRDARGQAVGNLRKEDFRLFDNGKPQGITHFSIETPATGVEHGKEPAGEEPALKAEPETALAPTIPRRYLALYFDDVHASFEDIVRTRMAVTRYLATALQPGDRAGLFNSSGQSMVDFTSDRDKFQDALLHLQPRPIVGREDNACPEISDYQAYQMVEQRDPFATEIANEEAYHCYCKDLPVAPLNCRQQAQDRAAGDAVRILANSETESEYTLRGLERLVRRISALPGQRTIVLISPGFLTVTKSFQIEEIADRALHSNVVINTLDSKGLYAQIPLGDASKRPVVIADRPDLMGRKSQLLIDRVLHISDALFTLANDTGGTFFHNSNDLDEGFRRVGALPEVYYVLGFSPQKLKPDGRFHTLKVNLLNSAHFTLQARRGYYAPRKALDASEAAKEEIEQAIFSQEESDELPIEVHTQFFKISDQTVKLSVLTRLDLRFLRFRKQEGRNLNNLTFVTALFDHDGNYVKGAQKVIELRLFDHSLETLSKSGITTRSSFDVPPGAYLVREVVRDSEGGQLSGLNRSVEIPF